VKLLLPLVLILLLVLLLGDLKIWLWPFSAARVVCAAMFSPLAVLLCMGRMLRVIMLLLLLLPLLLLLRTLAQCN
jgi:hypothetical protein